MNYGNVLYFCHFYLTTEDTENTEGVYFKCLLL